MNSGYKPKRDQNPKEFNAEFMVHYNATIKRLNILTKYAKDNYSSIDEVKRKFIPTLMYPEDGEFILQMYNGADPKKLMFMHIFKAKDNKQSCLDLMNWLCLSQG